MRILVTGRQGQLARALAEASEADGAIQLLFAGRPHVDLEQPGQLAAAIKAAAPDLVINAAAYTEVDRAEDEPKRAMRVNGAAAGEAAEAARAAGAPIIQISTDYVFDGQGSGAWREEARVGPLSVYGRTKLAGEEAVRGVSPDHLIVRTAWVYSSWGRNFVRTMLGAAAQRDTLTVVDDQVGSPTSAVDLAGALLTAGRRALRGEGLGRTYHCAGSGETSWFGFATEIMRTAREAGLPTAAVEPVPSSRWPTKAVRPRNSVLDSRRFAETFGVRLPEWQESVAAVVGRLATA
ncbi:dTDP-4-dehydrorhamnose reductase [Sphingomonas ginkgonis]|uniref:dTDP-4-dehydrorhamnose reductase n=1 Tax=Sphingomonas ginkgonis TaxID=2315330 RepID=A0A3R9X7V9_9SPHN|nr:dTDP-4-dehydrorhamnose reductase [Sphingomonas ginkgonis]